MSASPIFLVARRDYLAYVGAWGFWLSLITAPLIIAVLMFAPLLLARAEPPRVLAVIAECASDAASSSRVRRKRAPRARAESAAMRHAAPASKRSRAAFDAAPRPVSRIAAARRSSPDRAPRAFGRVSGTVAALRIARPPAPAIERCGAHLDRHAGATGWALLYGALNIRRDEACAGRHRILEHRPQPRRVLPTSPIARYGWRSARGARCTGLRRVNRSAPELEPKSCSRPARGGGEAHAARSRASLRRLGAGVHTGCVVFSGDLLRTE